MKQALSLTSLVIFSLFVKAQITSTFKADVNKEAEEEIKKMEFFLASLLEKGDITTYSGYVTDDYIRISRNGVVETKQQVLESMQNNRGTGKMTMNPHALAVRVYENTAILSGMLDIETQKDDKVTKTSSVFTKVFIRKNGKWYLASLQGTPVNK